MDNIQYNLGDPNTSFSLEHDTSKSIVPPPPQEKKKSDPEIINTVSKTDKKVDEDAEKTKKTKEFEDKIKNYVLKNSPVLAILTPCFGSIAYVDFMGCLIKTIDMLRYFNIQVVVEFCKNDSLISRARNNLIAKAMTKTDVTHVLFIDNDIVWDPIEVLKLLLSEKDIIGGIYPLKQYKWDRVSNPTVLSGLLEKKQLSQLKDLPNESVIQMNMLDYNVNFLENTIKVENNLTKVKHIATGFMMIRRVAIEKMMTAFPSTKYTDDISFLLPNENKYAYALFDCGVEDDHYYSEDWMFCHRWSKMGGDIYVDVSINLTHIGIESYQGSFISTTI
jgi:glycosyltransferase involved in cell wall biosynthesis